MKAPKAERPSRAGAAFVLRRSDGAVLLRTRPPRGLLGGMTEVPTTEWSADFDLAEALAQAPLAAPWKRLPGSVEHVFTHFALRLTIFLAEADAPPPEGARFVAATELKNEALPTVMRKVVAHALKA